MVNEDAGTRFSNEPVPPVTSIGEPLHKNGHTELATIGYLENIANPEPKAPLPPSMPRVVSSFHAQSKRWPTDV